MTGRHALGQMTRVHVAVGATAIAIPASAALADAATTPPAGSDLAIELASERIGYGEKVVVHGRAPRADAGQGVSLQLAAAAPARPAAWRTVASGIVGSGGAFRLTARLRRSGILRAVGSWQSHGQTTSTNSSSSTTGSTATSTSASATVSAAQDISGGSNSPRRVTVAARLEVSRRQLDAFGQAPAVVQGRLLPGAPGRRVGLEALRGGRWQTIASTQTHGGGRFALRFSPSAMRREQLRVEFPGDRINGPTSGDAGSVTVFTQSLASWYDDGGTTGCGFHAYYGVANVSLPCGTKVTFSYGRRTVNAVVDDRGPYAGGRRWDLNQNTASALGFSGAGPVWSSQ